MYAFLNWQTLTLAMLIVAIVSLAWGYLIREPFVVNSPVRRALKRARKRDVITLLALAVAVFTNVFTAL